jgi:predicted dehydrogenase
MKVAIIGCGYVADYYMQCVKSHPGLEVTAALDVVHEHADRFRAHWGVPVFYNSNDLLKNASFDLALNLTNPHSHYEVSRVLLEHGKHVYSEKPLAMSFSDAQTLVALAESRGLSITSAPCNHLSESAQAARVALKKEYIGRPKLVYAEMDDGFVALFPYDKWANASGAPWPFKDEFEVGCTLEHAGYYLTWLMLFFGPVRRVVFFRSLQHPGKPVNDRPEAPDFSVACLEFHSGMVARLTCSILAPRDHSLRIIGDRGLLYVDDCWFYNSRVYYRKYLRIRRRSMLSPLKNRIPLRQTGPEVKRYGAAAMDFARGPAEMALAITEGRRSRVPTDFSLHFNEVTLAIQNEKSEVASYLTQSTFDPLDPVDTPIM